MILWPLFFQVVQRISGSVYLTTWNLCFLEFCAMKIQRLNYWKVCLTALISPGITAIKPMYVFFPLASSSCILISK